MRDHTPHFRIRTALRSKRDNLVCCGGGECDSNLWLRVSLFINLESITIPTRSRDLAPMFWMCPELTSIAFSGSVETIGANPSGECGLLDVRVIGDVQNIKLVSRVLFTKK